MSELAAYSDYLTKNKIPLRLSCRTRSGWPVVISLWYLYREGRIYCATQENARIVSYLEHEPRCAFEVAGDLPPYCGVRGQARAHVDRDQGEEILEALLIRYLGGTDNPLARDLLKDAASEVALELEPINCFSWDFSGRMESVLPGMLRLVKKECPG